MIASLPEALDTAFDFANHLHRQKDLVLCATEELHHSRIGFPPLPSFTEHIRIDEIHGYPRRNSKSESRPTLGIEARTS